MIPLPPPSYEQVIAAVAACDIPKAGIQIIYEDELQSDVVRISDLGTLSEPKLLCLRAAIHPFYLLEIEGEDQKRAYYEVERREDRREAKAEALQWFRDRGLLTKLPKFDPSGGDVLAFLARVEVFCGYEPGSALRRYGSDFVTLERGALTFPSSPEQSAKFECLMKVMAATDLEEHGLAFGFLGNEQRREGNAD